MMRSVTSENVSWIQLSINAANVSPNEKLHVYSMRNSCGWSVKMKHGDGDFHLLVDIKAASEQLWLTEIFRLFNLLSKALLSQHKFFTGSFSHSFFLLFIQHELSNQADGISCSVFHLIVSTAELEAPCVTSGSEERYTSPASHQTPRPSLTVYRYSESLSWTQIKCFRTLFSGLSVCEKQ